MQLYFCHFSTTLRTTRLVCLAATTATTSCSPGRPQVTRKTTRSSAPAASRTSAKCSRPRPGGSRDASPSRKWHSVETGWSKRARSVTAVGRKTARYDCQVQVPFFLLDLFRKNYSYSKKKQCDNTVTKHKFGNSRIV